MEDKDIRQKLIVQTKFWNAQEGYEKGKTQQFWNSILKCFDPNIKVEQTIVYEKQVKDPTTGSTKFIDAYIPHTKVLIEQKSSHIALDKPEPQSDGIALTPFQQAERYDNWLPVSEKARYIICCNFRTIEIHDRNKPLEPPFIIPFTEDGISKNYYRLKFLLDSESTVSALEIAVSKAAALQIGSLYNDIIKLYSNTELTPELFHNINVFCVRLVFCLYAEDSLVFSRKDMFGLYLQNFNKSRDEFRLHLKLLFLTLNTPPSERDSEDIRLNEFPYTNGGLFAANVKLPKLTETIAFNITQKFSLGFDWSPINPAIFGAMFESTLSSKDRREGGMHYTTTENIDKALAPLFLSDLRSRLSDATKIPDLNTKRDALLKLQDELASIRILDPACGSGNFLTYCFMELRRMENKILYELHTAGVETMHATSLRVSLSQFHGFEINEFAVDTAKTALWIAQNQMLHETQQILGENISELPLCNIDTIHCVNALRINWEDYVNPSELDYIVGNPPFVGHQWRSQTQKEDMDLVFNGFGNYGKLDYVACWYKKAADFMQNNKKIRCAFVSTNSIVQGESVATMWKPLFDNSKLNINFAYRTFRWESDSIGMAHVHCVIIGFSIGENDFEKKIIDEKGISKNARNINGYLLDAPNVFIENRGKPLMQGLSKMSKGSQPTDGGNLILSAGERDELIKKYPQTSSFIRQYVSADDFINNKLRYCLWLKGVTPNEYTKIKPIMERLEKVREMRLKSPTASVKRDAEIPMLFTQIRQPETDYLVVPEVSSEQRKYIPIGFMSKDIIVSNMIYAVPNASLYLFGVLISKVHMSWMRIMAGRLEMRYRYTPAVYNNFPFCNPSKEQRAEIENTAKGILDARALFSKASLADLYNELTMPPELRKAHNENDRAVLTAYGMPKDASEAEMVGRLFEMINHL